MLKCARLHIDSDVALTLLAVFLHGMHPDARHTFLQTSISAGQTNVCSRSDVCTTLCKTLYGFDCNEFGSNCYAYGTFRSCEKHPENHVRRYQDNLAGRRRSQDRVYKWGYLARRISRI
jgi:hypothetical protein